jgi:hypothetical protein
MAFEAVWYRYHVARRTAISLEPYLYRLIPAERVVLNALHVPVSTLELLDDEKLVFSEISGFSYSNT